jgi:hypothetical protein
VNGPTPIGEVIDGAMRELLGAEGFDRYLTLCRQTHETRERIIEEARCQFARFFAEETGGTRNRLTLTTTMAIEARNRAERRVQREIGERIGAEELRFKAACETLFKWVARRPDGECDGCGG